MWTLVLKDPRIPRISKWLLGAALAYLASPVDIVPDFIPVLGQLDDLVIVPMLFWVAVRFIPREVVSECRRKVSPQENALPVTRVDS
ncbi:MAG: YkvA family protein [Candidatus Cryosericum sp.]